MALFWRLIEGIARDLILVLLAGFFVGFLAGRWNMHRSTMIEKRAIATTIDLALATPRAKRGSRSGAGGTEI